jgi:hypothetical protein
MPTEGKKGFGYPLGYSGGFFPYPNGVAALSDLKKIRGSKVRRFVCPFRFYRWANSNPLENWRVFYAFELVGFLLCFVI